MSFFAKLVREPLVHFLIIGAGIFALSSLVGKGTDETPQDRIVITQGRVDQLGKVFAKTWQRAPTQEELRRLIDAYIKEEIFYREAVKLELDKNDTLVRRRMQQKMEFLTEPPEELLDPSDAELQAFLDANKETFRLQPITAFQQVYINPEGGDAPPDVRARKTLSELKSTPVSADFQALGDRTLLPAEMPPSSQRRIASTFGSEFARKLADQPQDEWVGPLKSTYGLHLVRVTEHRNAHIPELKDIRARVERAWRSSKRRAFKDKEYEALRARYAVELPGQPKSGAKAEETRE